MEQQEVNNTIAKPSTKGWLQRLKDESWEAELLVSAIAIFGTFKMFDVINWGTNFFIDVLNPNQYLIGYFIMAIGLLAISILAAMFLIHFFLRAYWIGLVGLNSVFPDYSIEDSAYSKIYTEKILGILPKLKDSIQKVDELCSVIFSVAFTLLLIYAYMSIFVSVYLLVYNLLSAYIPFYILLIPAVLMGVFMLVQMVITFKANFKSNKEKEGLQNLSFKVNKFVSKIIYGPFYKSILQVTMIFGSNFKKKKSLIYLVLSFILVGLLVFGKQITNTNIFYLIVHKKYFNTTKVYSSFYNDENKNNTFLLTPEIESDKVEANVLKIFIPVFKHEENMKTEFCGDDNENSELSLEVRREEWNTFILDCYNQYYHIYINDKKIDVEFLRLNAHSRTKQSGVISYLDISNLKKGVNSIEVKKEFGETKILNWKIPFYYIPKN
ncbi:MULTISPECIES: hypothetical protein [Tenacibaculum]|uniref:hypothetical protein n=1 Tax=Tenacibaculum TaxID=104267 RepID=UPI001F0B5A3E|nr:MULTISPECIES: hypothetical protein [Tenacibaculum]MCH3881729.1 hypothetical protein [Tenacibaculum aquimarinum]MDO6598703.1 hypothetical protein [Tenacibaculum sp. 1_MG-2023]